MNGRRAFTLIELLIASAAFALATAGFVSILISSTRVQSRQASMNEVETQGQFLLQQFQYYIQSARIVDMTVDASSTVLRLRESNAANDPTQISLSGGIVNLQQGLAGALQPLTTSKVTVSNLSFARHFNLNGSSTAYGTDSVSYSFTVGANTSNTTMYYAQTFQSSAAVLAPVPQIALIQQVSTTTANTGVTTIQAAYPSANASGNLLIAVVSNTGSTSAVVTLVDTAGNAWTKIANPTFGSASQQMAIFYAPNAVSGQNTVTASFTQTVSNPSLFLYEYRGAVATAPFDASSTQTQTGVTSFSSGLASPTSTVELVFGVLYLTPLSGSTAAGSGFAMESSSSISNTFIEDQDTYVTGPVSAGWTSGSAASSSAVVVTFRAGVGGGGGGGGGGSGHIANGENASNLLGQYDASGNPLFTKGGPNNGPNALGVDLSTDVALDSVNHRLFVADAQNNRVLVFALDANNNITTTSASYVLGQPNFMSKTWATTQNGLYNPSGVSYESANNRLFVTDQANNRVMVFNVAPGTIQNGENADYILGQQDFTSNWVGSDTQNGFYWPYGVSYDAANSRLFVGDAFDNRVMVFNVAPGTIQNGENADYVLGQPNFMSRAQANTQNGFWYPADVAYDSASNRLFVTDPNNNRVMAFNVATGTIQNGENADYVLGQPNFTSRAQATTQNGFWSPFGASYDSANNRLFVADSNNSRVMAFSVAPGTIQNGMNADYVLGQPNFTSHTQATTQNGLVLCYGTAYDSANNRLFVIDQYNYRVMVFNVASGTIQNGENASYLVGQYDASGNPLFTKAGPNGGVGALGFVGSYPDSKLDSVNHRLFVTDSGHSRVLVFTLDSYNNVMTTTPSYVLGQPNFTSDAPATTQNGLNGPFGAAYDSANNRLFVADNGNSRIMVFNVAPGTIQNGMNASYVLGQQDFTHQNWATTQNGFWYPTGAAYDSANNRLFVTDQANNRVMVFNVASGTIQNGENADYVLGQQNFTSGGYATTQNGFYYPQGAAYDSASSHLFVADYFNNRVMVFNVASGTIQNGMNADYVLGQQNFTSGGYATTQNGFWYPAGASYDSANNRLFVMDLLNARVMIYDNVASGTIQNGENADYVLGQPNFTSNGAFPTQNGIYHPTGAAYDSANNRLFVADNGFSRVMIFNVAP